MGAHLGRGHAPSTDARRDPPADQSESALASLPWETLVEVCACLAVKDVLRLSSSCRLLRNCLIAGQPFSSQEGDGRTIMGASKTDRDSRDSDSSEVETTDDPPLGPTPDRRLQHARERLWRTLFVRDFTIPVDIEGLKPVARRHWTARTTVVRFCLSSPPGDGKDSAAAHRGLLTAAMLAWRVAILRSPMMRGHSVRVGSGWPPSSISEPLDVLRSMGVELPGQYDSGSPCDERDVDSVLRGLSQPLNALSNAELAASVLETVHALFHLSPDGSYRADDISETWLPVMNCCEVNPGNDPVLANVLGQIFRHPVRRRVPGSSLDTDSDSDSELGEWDTERETEAGYDIRDSTNSNVDSDHMDPDNPLEFFFFCERASSMEAGDDLAYMNLLGDWRQILGFDLWSNSLADPPWKFEVLGEVEAFRKPFVQFMRSPRARHTLEQRLVQQLLLRARSDGWREAFCEAVSGSSDPLTCDGNFSSTENDAESFSRQELETFWLVQYRRRFEAEQRQSEESNAKSFRWFKPPNKRQRYHNMISHTPHVPDKARRKKKPRRNMRVLRRPFTINSIFVGSKGSGMTTLLRTLERLHPLSNETCSANGWNAVNTGGSTFYFNADFVHRKLPGPGTGFAIDSLQASTNFLQRELAHSLAIFDSLVSVTRLSCITLVVDSSLPEPDEEFAGKTTTIELSERKEQLTWLRMLLERFLAVLTDQHVEMPSVVVIANKQDEPHCMPLEQIAESLGLNDQCSFNYAVIPTSSAFPESISAACEWIGEFSQVHDPTEFHRTGCQII